MQTIDIISSIFVHGAEDSSSFQSIQNYLYKLSGKRLSGKRLSGKGLVRETSCQGNVSRISRADTHFPQKLPFDLYLTFILIHFNVYRRSQ